MAAPAWVQRSISRWRALTVRQAVIGTVITAAFIRVWCLAGVPLTITNDGVWYLMWARKLLAGQPVEWHPARTPGYALFLAAVFAVCGVGPVAVLIAQHALGILSSGLVARMAARLGGPRPGVILGVLCAVDPVVLGMECYVLSETLATSLLVLCAAIVLLTRRTLRNGIGLGVALGVLCLTRPAFQAAAPFLLAGWIWGRPAEARIPPVHPGDGATQRIPRWYGGLVSVAVGLFAVTGPWLAHNWRSGVIGMSSANSIILWVGVCESGLLADDFPLPADVRADYERSVKPAPDNDENALQFVVRLNAWREPQSRSLLSRWAVHSIVSSPTAYLAMAVRALGWQLEVFPPGAHARYDEMAWLIGRLPRDGRTLPGQWLPNYNVTGKPADTDLFVMPTARGPIARYFRWWSGRWWVGVPRAILFLAAATAIVIAFRRRQWAVCGVLLASFAYVGAHAAFLLVPSRYSLPCWVLWWIGLAVVVRVVRETLIRARTPEDRLVARGSDG